MKFHRHIYYINNQEELLKSNRLTQIWIFNKKIEIIITQIESYLLLLSILLLTFFHSQIKTCMKNIIYFFGGVGLRY